MGLGHVLARGASGFVLASLWCCGARSGLDLSFADDGSVRDDAGRGEADAAVDAASGADAGGGGSLEDVCALPEAGWSQVDVPAVGSGGESGPFALAIDSSCRAHVAFVTGESEEDEQLEYATDRGAGWQAEVVTRPRGPLAQARTLWVGADGSPVMAYATRRTGGVRVWRAARSAESWRAVALGRVDGDVSIAHASSGGVSVVSATEQEEFFLSSEDGGWSIELLEVPELRGLTRDGKAVLHAAFSLEGDWTTLWYGRLDRGAWTEELVERDLDNARTPAAIVPDGAQVWMGYADGREIHVALRTAEGTWQPELVGESEGRGPDVALAVDTSGVPHVAWLDYMHHALRHSTRSADGWSVEEAASPVFPGHLAALALDARGGVVLASYYPAESTLRVLRRGSDGPGCGCEE